MENDKQPKVLPTLDDLMRMGKGVEVYDGVFHNKHEEASGEMSAGVVHHIIARNIYRLLDAYTQSEDLGEVFFDGMHYLMFSAEPGLKDSFLPDLSYIGSKNLMVNFDPHKPYPGVPDLAVEVVSPTDDPVEVQQKTRIYLDKGTAQVWVIYPRVKEVHQYRSNQPDMVRRYVGSTTLDVTDLFPNLTLTTDAIFTLPDWVK